MALLYVGGLKEGSTSLISEVETVSRVLLETLEVFGMGPAEMLLTGCVVHDLAAAPEAVKNEKLNLRNASLAVHVNRMYG